MVLQISLFMLSCMITVQ